MTKTEVKEIRSIVEKALTKSLKSKGYSVDLGNIRYTDTDIMSKITISKGSNADADKRSFETDHAYWCGFKIGGKNPAGKTFTSNGSKFKIVRFDSKKRKYPVICTKKSDGKSYKFAVDTILENIIQ